MHVPYSMDDSEPDLHGGMGGGYGNLHNPDGEDQYEYTPTQKEMDEALADAGEMNYNMRTYGTIDKPNSGYPNVRLEHVQCAKWYTQEDMDKVIQHHIGRVMLARVDGYDAGWSEGYDSGYKEGNLNCQHR